MPFQEGGDLVKLHPFLDALEDLIAFQPPDRLGGPLRDPVEEERIGGVGPGIARDDLEIRQHTPGAPGRRSLRLIFVCDTQAPGAESIEPDVLQTIISAEAREVVRAPVIIEIVAAVFGAT